METEVGVDQLLGGLRSGEGERSPFGKHPVKAGIIASVKVRIFTS